LLQFCDESNIKQKNMKKIIPVIGILLAACSAPKLSSYATKTDLAGKAKYDFNKSTIRSNGKGFAIDMQALGKMPKRVALVSFYIDDPGLTKVSGTNSTGKSYNTTNTGSDNAVRYANAFYTLTEQTMKEDFNKYGIQLLTPAEFLTDDDKKAAYNDFVVKHTKLNEFGAKLGKFLKNAGSAGTSIEIDEAANGFRLITINKRDNADPKKKAVPSQNLAGSMDGQMIESVGYDLAKSLEVDAVLIVYNSQLADKKWGKSRFWLSAVNMQMFGPNPTPLQEGKKDNNSYNKGLFYCGVRMPFKKGLCINPKIKDEAKKAENDKNNDIAYRNMISGCVNKIGTYLQKGLVKK
jgi:hypothetical protein